MIIHSMSVEPVYGWCFGACEYWLGEPQGGVMLSYMKADFLWWVKQTYPELTPCEVILIHDDACDVWVVGYLIEKGL